MHWKQNNFPIWIKKKTNSDLKKVKNTLWEELEQE